MSASERPTAPPTPADDFALEFSRAVARKDKALRARGSSSSGLIFALAHAHAAVIPETDPDTED